MSAGDISSTSDFIKPVTTDFIMPEEPVTQKRTYEGNIYGEPPAKKPAKSIVVRAGFVWNLQELTNAADAVERTGKSPVSALNELGVKVDYTVLRQGGPAHCPSFTVAVHVAGMTYEGWGHSKRDARAAAARACLSALLARAGRVLSSEDPHNDFTQDVQPKEKALAFQYTDKKLPDAKSKMASGPVSPPLSDMSPSAALFGAAEPSATASKSPINLLYEKYPGLNFNCSYGDGSPLSLPHAPLQLSHSMRFKVLCQIKDQVYEGYGSSKKLAKLAAAHAALAALNEGWAGLPRPAPGAATTPYGTLPQLLADHIAKSVNEKFNELMKHDLVHSKRKVLAGIVITIGDKFEGSKVIAVTTGTKCVSGEYMSVRGQAVNDCHAEVAARRCLQRHLYAQLLEYAQQPDPRVPLERSDLEPLAGGGYQLKPSRRVHLYVSTAPCGDGRIFSPHEHRDPAPDPHPNRQARGQLRTKIESGEGTIPVKSSNYVQTWDGVLQGERLLTMSCSDKVARWCVVGLQGALLSRVLRPVYLHSLVLGSLLHPHHMYRALCGRIESNMGALPWPYRLHRPLLARAASTETRTPVRAPSFSVCWGITTPLPEILNAMTGKLENGQPSLLCKQAMFARWHHLLPKLKPLPLDSMEVDNQSSALRENPATLLYSEAKLLCPGYQEAKKCLFDAFENANLGKWIKKPLEQDEFCCEITEADPKHLFAWAGDDLRYNTMQEPLRADRGLEYGESGVICGKNDKIGDDSDEIGGVIDENDVESGVNDDFRDNGDVFESSGHVNENVGCNNNRYGRDCHEIDGCESKNDESYGNNRRGDDDDSNDDRSRENAKSILPQVDSTLMIQNYVEFQKKHNKNKKYWQELDMDKNVYSNTKPYLEKRGFRTAKEKYLKNICKDNSKNKSFDAVKNRMVVTSKEIKTNTNILEENALISNLSTGDNRMNNFLTRKYNHQNYIIENADKAFITEDDFNIEKNTDDDKKISPTNNHKYTEAHSLNASDLDLNTSQKDADVTDKTKSTKTRKYENNDQISNTDEGVAKIVNKTGSIPKNKYLLRKLEKFEETRNVVNDLKIYNRSTDTRQGNIDADNKNNPKENEDIKDNTKDVINSSSGTVNNLIHDIKQLNINTENDARNDIRDFDKISKNVNISSNNTNIGTNTYKQDEIISILKEKDSKFTTDENISSQKQMDLELPIDQNKTVFKNVTTNTTLEMKSKRLAKYKHILQLASNLKVDSKKNNPIEIKTNIEDKQKYVESYKDQLTVEANALKNYDNKERKDIDKKAKGFLSKKLDLLNGVKYEPG